MNNIDVKICKEDKYLFPIWPHFYIKPDEENKYKANVWKKKIIEYNIKNKEDYNNYLFKDNQLPLDPNYQYLLACNLNEGINDIWFRYKYDKLSIKPFSYIEWLHYIKNKNILV